jgi:hypothetical protein
MFLLDSLMISGIQWTLKTVLTAAEAEMNDDTALRERLLEAELRREMGEISDGEFRDIEADLLARIREIKQRREGQGALTLGGGQPMATSPDTTFQVEAEVSGDFHANRSDGPPPSRRPARPVKAAAAAGRAAEPGRAGTRRPRRNPRP